MPKKNNTTKKKTPRKINNEVSDIKLNQEKTTEEYYNILEQDKNHPILKTIFLIILFLICIILVYIFVIKDSKTMFTSGINKSYELIANKVIKLSKNDIFKNKFEVLGTLEIDSNDEYLSKLNNYLYSFEFDLNREKSNYRLNLNTERNQTSISNINYYLQDNKYYLNLGNNFDKTIELNNNILDFDDQIILLYNIDFNKLVTSIKGIKNIINSNIDRNKLTKGEEIINNKNYEYINLTLSKNEYSEFLSKIIDEIKNNNNIINNLASSFKTDNITINNYLDNILKNNLTNTFDNINFKYYTSGLLSSIVGLKIYTNETKYLSYIIDNKYTQFIINYNNYYIEYNKDDKKGNMVIKKDNNTILELDFKEVNDSTYDINYKYENNSTGNIYYSKYDKTKDKSGNIKFTNINNDIKTSFELNYIIDNYKEFSIDNNICLNSELTKEELQTITKNINYSLKDNIIKDYILSKIK